MKRNIFSALATAAVALSVGATIAEAASVVTNGPDIRGVTGVGYNGTLYDATFVSGSCGATFIPCGGQTAPFAFTTATAAEGILRALATQDPPVIDLLNLVFAGDTVDGYSPASLRILTPYFASFSVVTAVDYLSVVSNGTSIGIAADETYGINAVLTGPPGVYSIWTAESTAMPEPGSATLLAAGAAAAARRKKRKAQDSLTRKGEM